MGVGPYELLLLSLLLGVVPIILLYWVVRLAVRHGVMDADRRRLGEYRVNG
jgi:hypothetical protein